MHPEPYHDVRSRRTRLFGDTEQRSNPCTRLADPGGSADGQRASLPRSDRRRVSCSRPGWRSPTRPSTRRRHRRHHDRRGRAAADDITVRATPRQDVVSRVGGNLCCRALDGNAPAEGHRGSMPAWLEPVGGPRRRRRPVPGPDGQRADQRRRAAPGRTTSPRAPAPTCSPAAMRGTR